MLQAYPGLEGILTQPEALCTSEETHRLILTHSSVISAQFTSELKRQLSSAGWGLHSAPAAQLIKRGASSARQLVAKIASSKVSALLRGVKSRRAPLSHCLAPAPELVPSTSA